MVLIPDIMQEYFIYFFLVYYNIIFYYFQQLRSLNEWNVTRTFGHIINVYKLFFFLQEYILGNKKLSIIPVAFSLMSSFMCATSMFGLAAENYLRGTHFMIINLSNVLGTPIVAYVFLPVFYKLGYISVYQVLCNFRGNCYRLKRLIVIVCFATVMVHIGIIHFRESVSF